ncbi:FAD-dependent monooxygenase [Natronosporangium hydrolyticum]|uniref:FAD-dependent monooxygenase n=1 Tax=Natronosporangium hydrolyticum TaxID=2811111 RepID=A0A895YQB1_9ACTN|nr:NAD(P)/FAD-dependent oxidoreductase [Natronosporangium hydrolyticum]QSB16310.1 FAD-dependent monooxygenase [Natronosporangium hydrolyticum]
MSATTPDGRLGRVAVVGAGLAGSLLAVLLGRRGFAVDVFERRGDPRAGGEAEGRSINLGISARGIRALRAVGLWDGMAPSLVPMRGRVIHQPGAPLRFQPYGTRPEEILHSIRRNELNAVLVDRAEKEPAVRFHFGWRGSELDRDGGRLTLTKPGTGERRTVEADLIIGADGAFSEVRQLMHRGLPVNYRQDFLDWGYRELTIRSNPDGSARTPIEALHVWPSRRGLVVAHPNTDNSLTCTVLLPHHDDPQRPDQPSFDSLTTEAAVASFFATEFGDLPELVPDLADQYFAHPVSQLVTIRTAPWHHRDRVVLVGDACHAIYPFYGQGMNSAFEDCLVLDDCLARYGVSETALATYQQSRKPHTDVLADLATDNFIELRDRVRNPLHMLRAQADLALHRLAPQLWQPLYRMVSHTAIPYADALRRAQRQDRLLTWGAAAATVGTALVARAAWRRRRG